MQAMRLIHDESRHLDQYINNLQEKIEGGQCEKKNTLMLIEALIDELREARKPYAGSIPDGLVTLSKYLVLGIDHYVDSLDRMRNFLVTPTEELMQESRELAERGSLILNNLRMIIAETEGMLKAASPETSGSESNLETGHQAESAESESTEQKD